MITFRPLDTELDRAWIKDRIGCTLTDDMRGIVAVKSPKPWEPIVAAFLACNWTESSCQCHQAIDDVAALKAGIHREFAEYVFGQSGRQMMIGMVPDDNEAAKKLNLHYGMVEAARIPDAHAKGIDIVIYTMTAEQCRYYKEPADGLQKLAAA